jgi:predicted metal-dependent hydrolase
MEIPYTLIRSNRKTIAIHITPAGEVEVRCPRRCSRREVETFVVSKQEWIRRHLEAIDGQPVLPKLSETELRALAEQAAASLPERVRQLAAWINVSYGRRITIRSQKTRWGSCSAQGNLNFNCLLMLTPQEVRDYVVIHELCHRKHLNHSREFWEEVQRFCPDYRTWKKWLKENQQHLIGRLP